MLLHKDSPLLVVPWLPNADNHPVCLNLVDVATLDPHALDSRHRGRHDRRSYNWCSNNWRSHHSRRRHNHGRRRTGVIYGASHDPADEARPEVASATAPATMMVVVERRPEPMARPHVVETGARPTAMMTAEAAMRPCKRRAADCHARETRHDHFRQHFLLHLAPSLSYFAQAHSRATMS